MNARYPASFFYPNTQPEQYTNDKTSAYFTDNGITQLGFIRYRLDGLLNNPVVCTDSSDETKSNIDSIIKLIDGLADKSRGSSIAVGKRLKRLDRDFMKIFPVQQGAIVFHDTALLTAAKIVTQGIAAIEPTDLNPPKLMLKSIGKNNFKLSETIKSTMNSICAQINFFIQLNENAIESEALYNLSKRILDMETLITSIDVNDERIIDGKINKETSQIIQPIHLLNQVNDVIRFANECIDEYARNACSSITVETKGIGRSPIATVQLMLKTPCSLTKVVKTDNPEECSIGDEELLPVFMTTSVPFRVLQLCRTLKGSLEKTESHIKKHPDAVATARLHSTANYLETAIIALETAMVKKAGNLENATLKANLEQFRENLLAKLAHYQTSKKTTNEGKLAICNSLAESIKAINFEFEFKPASQFTQFISIVASHYYAHNDYCVDNKKAPRKLGDILENAMNTLAAFSSNICAHDCFYHQTNLQMINEILDRKPENTNKFGM